jgi:hypothetical protein
VIDGTADPRPASMLRPFTFDTSDDEPPLPRVPFREITEAEEAAEDNWADDGEHTPRSKTTPAADAEPEPDLDEPLYRLFPCPRPHAEAQANGLLASSGYRRLGDLLYVTSWDLLAIHGFGPACLEATRKALASRGIVLVDELDPDDLDDDDEPALPLLT